MNYEQVLKGVQAIPNSPPNSRQSAMAYVAYLRRLETEQVKENGGYVLRNKWFSRLTDQKAIDLYATVLNKGLVIDGDTVLIQSRGIEIVPDYTYYAYKNLVLRKYPDSKFDFGIVYDGDKFAFRKESGRVIYTHELGSPFALNRKIIGAYGIIKNTSGEFLEIINLEDIEKFRNVARTKTIWDAWFDRMVMKSIIKRICHTSFKDIVESIEKEDNENYDLDMVNISCEIQAELAACMTKADIKAFYDKHLPKSKNVNDLVAMCAKRKAEIQNASANGTTGH